MTSAKQVYDKRILLTGGCGFIGSHTLIHFVTSYPNYYIVNLDSLDYCATLNNIRSIEERPNYKFIEGNICDLKRVRRIFHQEDIDTIVHLAAKSHVDLSFNNSLEFTKTNVVGTNVLLILAREFGIKRFLHISTDEVYGGTFGKTVDEESVMNPTNPYSGSKAAGEMILRSYYNAFQLPVVTVRCNNVYGPNQFPEKVVPKFISLLHRNLKCYIHGQGFSKRSFLYVTDAVAAFDRVLHCGIVGQIYNIGTEFELSVMQLATDLINRVKNPGANNNMSDAEVASHLVFVEDRPFNDDSYVLRWDKIKQLGWEPVVPWDVGIQATIAWYKEHNAPDSHHWTRSEDVLTPFPQFDYDDVTPKPKDTDYDDVISQPKAIDYDSVAQNTNGIHI